MWESTHAGKKITVARLIHGTEIAVLHKHKRNGKPKKKTSLNRGEDEAVQVFSFLDVVTLTESYQPVQNSALSINPSKGFSQKIFKAGALLHCARYLTSIVCGMKRTLSLGEQWTLRIILIHMSYSLSMTKIGYPSQSRCCFLYGSAGQPMMARIILKH